MSDRSKIVDQTSYMKKLLGLFIIAFFFTSFSKKEITWTAIEYAYKDHEEVLSIRFIQFNTKRILY